MSLFEFLTWAEVSQSNDLIREQNAMISDMQSELAEKRREENFEKTDGLIIGEFEKLYKANGNVNVVQIHKIVALKEGIFRGFQQSTRKELRGWYPMPHNRLLPFGVVLAAGGLLYLAFTVERLHWLNLLMMGGLLFYIVKWVVAIRREKKTRQANLLRKEAYKRDAAEAAEAMKRRFPDLTPYGLYLKWYLDRRIQKVADALSYSYPHVNRRQMIVRFYSLFDMHAASPDFDYETSYIANMDGYFAEAFREASGKVVKSPELSATMAKHLV